MFSGRAFAAFVGLHVVQREEENFAVGELDGVRAFRNHGQSSNEGS